MFVSTRTGSLVNASSEACALKVTFSNTKRRSVSVQVDVRNSQKVDNTAGFVCNRNVRFLHDTQQLTDEYTSEDTVRPLNTSCQYCLHTFLVDNPECFSPSKTGRLVLVGNTEQLGAWDPARGAALTPVYKGTEDLLHQLSLDDEPSSALGLMMGLDMLPDSPTHTATNAASSQLLSTTLALPRPVAVQFWTASFQLPTGQAVEYKLVWLPAAFPEKEPLWEFGPNRLLLVEESPEPQHLQWRTTNTNTSADIRNECANLATTSRAQGNHPLLNSAYLHKVGGNQGRVHDTVITNSTVAGAALRVPSLHARLSKGSMKPAAATPRSSVIARAVADSSTSFSFLPDLGNSKSSSDVASGQRVKSGGGPGGGSGPGGLPMTVLDVKVVNAPTLGQGKELVLVGSSSALGNWDPMLGAKCTPSGGDDSVYACSVALPEGCHVEAKFVIRDIMDARNHKRNSGDSTSSGGGLFGMFSMGGQDKGKQDDTDKNQTRDKQRNGHHKAHHIKWEHGHNRRFEVVEGHRNLIQINWNHTDAMKPHLDVVECTFTVQAAKALPPGQFYALLPDMEAMGSCMATKILPLKWTMGNKYTVTGMLPRGMTEHGFLVRLAHCTFPDQEDHTSYSSFSSAGSLASSRSSLPQILDLEEGSRQLQVADDSVLGVKLVMTWNKPTASQLHTTCAATDMVGLERAATSAGISSKPAAGKALNNIVAFSRKPSVRVEDVKAKPKAKTQEWKEQWMTVQVHGAIRAYTQYLAAAGKQATTARFTYQQGVKSAPNPFSWAASAITSVFNTILGSDSGRANNKARNRGKASPRKQDTKSIKAAQSAAVEVAKVVNTARNVGGSDRAAKEEAVKKLLEHQRKVQSQLRKERSD